MKLHRFIENNLDAISDEWEAFARTLLPAAATMPGPALRDHNRAILLAIVQDMQKIGAKDELSSPSTEQRAPAIGDTVAATHGALRHGAGFNLGQLVSEFRAMRASVFALWGCSDSTTGKTPGIDEIARFDAATDQALGESVERYSSIVTASRDMFLAVLGHDLRSPLQSIEMAGRALISPDLQEAARFQIGVRIRRASKSMDGLITDLLEFTRSRLGFGIPIERSDCDVRQACEEALDVAKANDPEREFVRRIYGDLHMHADCARLRQTLSNLLNNAIQHGDQGAPVSLAAYVEEDSVVIAVANFGKPIPKEALRIIFDPLVQVSATTSDLNSRPKTSLGLGLFIAREIVLGHGGTIDAQSSTDSGTVFTIRLPRASSEELASEDS